MQIVYIFTNQDDYSTHGFLVTFAYNIDDDIHFMTVKEVFGSD